ncbi:GHMP_kinases_N domain-containing protein, partial [Haematococcus lacustris]
MEHEVYVCGRLCLVGEHSDWAGAFRASNPSIPPGKCVVVGTSEEAQSGGFLSYVAGTAYRLLTAHHIGGLELVNHTSTLPMSKGLSSSAAICVMVARAFNRVYDLKLTVRGEMEMAYQGEITTPSKCGRMDQACAFGSIPILLTFDGDLLHVEPITLKAPLHLVLVDLKAAKDTTAILTSLQAAYPVPRNVKQAGAGSCNGSGTVSKTFLTTVTQATTLSSQPVPPASPTT